MAACLFRSRSRIFDFKNSRNSTPLPGQSIRADSPTASMWLLRPDQVQNVSPSQRTSRAVFVFLR